MADATSKAYKKHREESFKGKNILDSLKKRRISIEEFEQNLDNPYYQFIGLVYAQHELGIRMSTKVSDLDIQLDPDSFDKGSSIGAQVVKILARYSLRGVITGGVNKQQPFQRSQLTVVSQPHKGEMIDANINADQTEQSSKHVVHQLAHDNYRSVSLA